MSLNEKKEVITDWVRKYTGDLFAWALNKTSDAGLAEDLVQETFLAAVEGWERFQGKSHPKTCLFGILKNKVADHYRRQAANPSF